MFVLIFLTLTYADTVLSTDGTYFHSKGNTQMVVNASVVARSDIKCAMICKSRKMCCRASYEADIGKCLMDYSTPCARRTRSTNGRTTIDKGKFPSCEVPAEVPSSTYKINGLDLFGKVKVGGKIEYTCNAKYFQTAGHLIRTCQVGQSWSGEAPVCKEKSCQMPPDVTGSTHKINGIVLSGKIKVGGSIAYTCKAGFYHATGDLARMCNSEQVWSGKTPVCKEKSCQMPPDVTGYVTGSTHKINGIVLSGKINVGGRIVYTCKAGFYHTTGDLARICNSEQVWSGKTPVCKEDCKRTQQGWEYDGRINYTFNNRQCQRWNVDSPHEHDFNQLDAENYCRNPDNEPVPWCYTVDPWVRWEFCTVPTCTMV